MAKQVELFLYIEMNLKKFITCFALSVGVSAFLAACSLAPKAPGAERCPPNQSWTDDVVARAVGLDDDRFQKLKSLRSLDNNDICTMPEAKLKRAIVKTEHPKPDHPGEWAKFRALQQSDESGNVDPNGLINALTQRHSMLAAEPKVGSGAGISSTQWAPIGPGNIGGRIRSIAVHPSDANQIWVGSVSGGIWKSNDGGTSWAAVNDFMSNLSISSLVISSTSSSTMYAGTGEGYFNADAVRGLGVFKSVDGGVTWNQLSSTNPALNGAWFYVNRLAVNPTAGNTLLAATNNGIFRTTDGGISWAQTAYTTQIADIRIDPLNGANAVASRGYYGGYIMYSTDGGVTWNNSNLSTAGRAEISYSRTSGLLYASVDYGSGSIYKSTDGGVTWTLVKYGLGHLSQQGWYDNTIWVDPTNSNHVITGGLDLYRSTDGGVNFSKISLWYDSRSVHADHHAIVASSGYNGTSNRTVFFGNDGGIYKATDISAVTQTSGWTNLNNGLAITQFYSGAGHTGTNGRIIGGTQDNGSLVYPGSGTTWGTFFGGDGGFSAVDPTDGNYIYGEYVYLQIHRSTNGGSSSASYIYSGITDAGGSSSNFIAPFALDPNAPSTMYAGGNALWRSTNVKAASPSWSSIQAGTGWPISQVHVAQGNSNVVWFGRNDGSVWKSTNATAGSPSFTRMGSGVLPGRMVTSLLVDPGDNNVVYVGFGGYLTTNLWKTTNGGSTWSNIGSALPPSPVRAVQRHPSNAAWLYAGTEVGIFTSVDGGANWSTTNDGPANASVETLTWLNSTDLLVSTHGRGMFKATASTATNYTLSVAKTGTGTGTITSSPAGINCGATCSTSFSSGSSVTLTATPAAGSAFIGWSGACTGTGACTISMSAAQTVTATFSSGLSLTGLSASTGSLLRYQLAVPSGATNLVFTTSGGTGDVDLYVRYGSEPSTAAYDCRSNNPGNNETCTIPAPVAGTYYVMLYSASTFNAVTLSGTYSTTSSLIVTKAGTGSGTVTSSPVGISCGADCTETFSNGTSVILTATPNPGSTFVGWSGGLCSGSASTCSFSINSNNTVTATFISPGGRSVRAILPIIQLLLD